MSDAHAPEPRTSAPDGAVAESHPLLDDQQLLERFVRTRDPAIFGDLLDRHQADLLRTAAALLGDDDRAQDAVQEAFLRLGRDVEQVLVRWPARCRSVGGWLATVVRHWCIDQLRQRRPVPMNEPEQHPDGAPTPASAMAAVDAGEALWKAVGDLPHLERAAVLLRYRDGLSYQDIAERLEKSATHVGVLLHQALGRLRHVASLRQEVGV